MDREQKNTEVMMEEEEQQGTDAVKVDEQSAMPDDDNFTNKICCRLLIPYSNTNEFIPFDSKDPRGLPFPPGRVISDFCHVSDDRNSVTITLQHGTRAQNGENGTYEDTLIALARDLLMFKNQRDSPLFCREYSIAITKLEEALLWLTCRAANRQAVGIHGHGGYKSSVKRSKPEQ